MTMWFYFSLPLHIYLTTSRWDYSLPGEGTLIKSIPLSPFL